MQVPMGIVAEAKDKEEDRGKQANLWTDKPPPDPTASQLMCSSHRKLCKKGICFGMLRLVKEEERKKREVKRGEVVRWVLLNFWPFGSLLVFNFSYLLLFVVLLKLNYMLPTYYFSCT